MELSGNQYHLCMQAITYQQYGPPEVLTLADIPRPIPAANQVLLEVGATSLNASDWEILTGKPFYARIWGLFKPKFSILGSDIAGTIVEVGEAVTQFQIGDRVLVDTFEKWGGLAEYTCAFEKHLVPLPDSLNFIEAATLPQAGVIAWQGLQSMQNLKAGKKVLIIGAGGGAGSFSIQLAKQLYQLDVTAVDNSSKQEFMKRMGADRVIDYSKEDYRKYSNQYDLILDMVGAFPVQQFFKLLRREGRYAQVGGTTRSILWTLIWGGLLSIFSTKKLGLLIHKQNTKDMETILQFVVNKQIVPPIAQTYSLQETPKAFEVLGKGMAKGKVVISLGKNSTDLPSS